MSLRKFPVHRVTIPSEMHVQLTEAEDRICQLLNNYVKETQEDASTQTVCRIAGGWVRDKLLGSQSNDIDIALSNKMGLAFAEGLAAYAREKGVDTGTISKIAQNPEQSKHLETATFKVFGLDIDLVNLRSEEYAIDSRIPTGVSFGTPLQDAVRRDITINTLFYNVHSREVEDFTEQGCSDLRNGIIRTPLPPRETFLDDPLRVLRCIRFASRFGFEIVPEIEEAAKDPVIQKAIVSKVARERVGEELAKMIKGPDPLRSIELVHNLSLYDPVFFVIPEVFSSRLSGTPGSPSTGLAAASILRSLLQAQEKSICPKLPGLHPVYYEAVTIDSTCAPRLYLAAALTPYKQLTYRDKKDKEQSLPGLLIRESLKLGTQSHFLDGIPLLFAASDVLKSAMASLSKLHPTSERVGTGSLLREKSIHNAVTGSHWTSSCLFSLVQELIEHYDAKEDIFDDGASTVVEKYNTFAQRVKDLKLQDVGEMKPLLDGRQIMATLEAKRPGAWLGQLLNKVVEWQLEYPEGTKGECIAWLHEQLRGGHIRVNDQSVEPAAKRPRIKQ